MVEKASQPRHASSANVDELSDDDSQTIYDSEQEDYDLDRNDAPEQTKGSGKHVSSKEQVRREAASVNSPETPSSTYPAAYERAQPGAARRESSNTANVEGVARPWPSFTLPLSRPPPLYKGAPPLPPTPKMPPMPPMPPMPSLPPMPPMPWMPGTRQQPRYQGTYDDPQPLPPHPTNTNWSNNFERAIDTLDSISGDDDASEMGAEPSPANGMRTPSSIPSNASATDPSDMPPSYEEATGNVTETENPIDAAKKKRRDDLAKRMGSNSNCKNMEASANCSNCMFYTQTVVQTLAKYRAGKNCIGCKNCSNVKNCTDCENCSNCKNCTDCYNCSNCTDCSGLRNASNQHGVHIKPEDRLPPPTSFFSSFFR